jgi:hypothetical protein
MHGGGRTYVKRALVIAPLSEEMPGADFIPNDKLIARL